MGHMEEIKDYWNLRANGFSLAVEEELKTEAGVRWKKIFQEYIKKEHANVLDDGTGAGFFPVILSSLGHCVTAIDYSEEDGGAGEKAVCGSWAYGKGTADGRAAPAVCR